MLVCIGMPVHVSACIFECPMSSNGSMCFGYVDGYAVFKKSLSGYLSVCAYLWRDSAREASPLPKGEWSGGGVLTGRAGPKKFMEAASWGRGNPFIQVSWRRRCWASMGGAERAAQVVSAGRQQGIGQMDWASPWDGMWGCLKQNGSFKK